MSKKLAGKTIPLTALAMLACGAANAATAVWDTPLTPLDGFGGLTGTWDPAASTSVYAEWNLFTTTAGATPDVGSFGVNSAAITETTGTGLVTGGGNIYSFAAASDFDLSMTTGVASVVDTIVLQLAIQGSPLDLSSVLLNGIAPSASASTFTAPLDQGFEEELLFVWENVGDIDNYVFDFTSSAAHLSLDQVAVHGGRSVVPVPAAVWLFGSALSVLGWVRKVTGGAVAA